MFKKSKEKEEKKSVVNKMGELKLATSKTSSERRLSENVVEQRSVTYSSTSYSSVRVTKTELGKSTVTSQTPLFNKSLSLFENQSSGLKPLGNKSFAIDAKPFNTPSSASNGGGYQSLFSRKLTPYNTDAKPFNTNLQTPQRNMSVHSTPASTTVSHNLPRYSSYLPQTSSHALSPAPSTQSLPTLNEPSPLDSRIPTYNTQGKKRGRVLVINNIKFLQEKQERKGAETDERNIRTLFEDMGFNVETFRNLKKAAMMDRVNKFSNDSSLKKVDISIVIMMSHGSNVDDSGKIIRGGFTQIYGTDDVGLPIDDVLDKFSTEKCPAMSGKPKIFIFQCCRGENEERTLHNDVAPSRNVVKKHADMLLAFSTLPGFFSIRDAQQGSWYIQGICEVFRNHAKEFDVETLLKIVDDRLSQKHPKYQQTSTYENRGFKRCFLHPK